MWPAANLQWYSFGWDLTFLGRCIFVIDISFFKAQPLKQLWNVKLLIYTLQNVVLGNRFTSFQIQPQGYQGYFWDQHIMKKIIPISITLKIVSQPSALHVGKGMRTCSGPAMGDAIQMGGDLYFATWDMRGGAFFFSSFFVFVLSFYIILGGGYRANNIMDSCLLQENFFILNNMQSLCYRLSLWNIFFDFFFSYSVDANLNSEQYCLVVPRACILRYMKHFHNKLFESKSMI